MTMRLVDLEPQFLRLSKPFTYTKANDIGEADALQIRCPACHWSFGRGRTPGTHVHRITLWLDQGKWGATGTGYDDLTLAAGKVPVVMRSGCRSRFTCRGGKVDFA
jgi:hypothetical protein